MSRSGALNRIINLDLVRAAAIFAVVVFHTVQLMGVAHPITQLINVGEYGVDLFFVLSGFLIGRLYWIEEKTHQSVNLFRFISRRILRVIFPYAIALSLSFLAVFIERQQPFDFRYLIFTQNYYAKIPFFLVSWSLCIEVHFYILLPFLLMLIRKLSPVHRAVILSLIVLIPIGLRLALVDYNDIQDFGYYLTATHFRFEGLILGVLAAYASVHQHFRVLFRSSFRYYIFTLATLFILSIPVISSRWMYFYGLTVLAALLSLSVLSLSWMNPLPAAKHPLTQLVACSSYSTYLIHPLVIHVSLRTLRKLTLHPFITGTVIVLFVFVTGYLFYLVVEKGSLAIRDKFAPKVIG